MIFVFLLLTTQYLSASDTIVRINITLERETVIVHDTVYVPVVDTVFRTDTLVFRDTVYIRDTVYLPCDTAITGPSPYGQDPDLYGDLIFHDEFEVDTLDTGKWDPHLHSGWITNPYKNWHFENGELHIWSRYDNGKFWDRNFDTNTKFRQLYGYFEIECKMPFGAGVRPAFWLYNKDDINGRFRPEIDIFEAFGYLYTPHWMNDSLRISGYATGVHLVTSSGHQRFGGDRFDEHFGLSYDLSADYHVYGCLWEPDGVTFYFDGQQLGPKVETDLLNIPMFIDLRLRHMEQAQLGSGVLSRSNPYTPTDRSNAFSIRYIRVWNLNK